MGTIRDLFKITILFVIFFGLFQSQVLAANADDARELSCNKSIFSKLKCKTQDYNPLGYFEKRKACIQRRDNADTVAQGKQIYKNCIKL